MITQIGVLRGTIRRRLLVNALVDPDEAARHLPTGIRPHVTDGATVAGCCLLDIDDLRPGAVPAGCGICLRATAHRIAAEWDDEARCPVVGVYVPIRHAASWIASVVGGRWVPGVHRRASVELYDDGWHLSWSMEPRRDACRFAVRVRASIVPFAPAAPCEPVGQTCLAACVGISPGRRGSLESVRMEPAHREAQLVEVDQLDSPLLASFRSAVPAPSYLMRDVEVSWTSGQAPPAPPAGPVRRPMSVEVVP